MTEEESEATEPTNAEKLVSEEIKITEDVLIFETLFRVCILIFFSI